jgi:PAT family beta-lactamase induction signal transducer AmpG
MADALQSYIRQDGFPAIFFFILFYRFGEAMIGKMTPLFLKDTIANGGLAVPNELFGPIKGFAGVVGIILGGLAGGWFVSKLGLRKAFWPLAVCMHAPNLLYLWASYQHPGIPGLYGIEFVDQFGYGFGFAAYGVYLMWVAQRGRYRTSHYAVGTGMGALCIATAGIVSGIVQKNFGYHGFFISVIFLSLPGLLSLLFIPLDDRPKLQTT